VTPDQVRSAMRSGVGMALVDIAAGDGVLHLYMLGAGDALGARTLCATPFRPRDVVVAKSNFRPADEVTCDACRAVLAARILLEVSDE
jgi:hypothetical protein